VWAQSFLDKIVRHPTECARKETHPTSDRGFAWALAIFLETYVRKCGHLLGQFELMSRTISAPFCPWCKRTDLPAQPIQNLCQILFVVLRTDERRLADWLIQESGEAHEISVKVVGMAFEKVTKNSLDQVPLRKPSG
jgi:hypothetical protein